MSEGITSNPTFAGFKPKKAEGPQRMMISMGAFYRAFMEKDEAGGLQLKVTDNTGKDTNIVVMRSEVLPLARALIRAVETWGDVD